MPVAMYIFLNFILLQQAASQGMQYQPSYMPVSRHPHVRIQSTSPHCQFPSCQPMEICNQHCWKPRCCPIYNAQPCFHQSGVPSYCVQSVVIGGREDCCCPVENKTCCQKRCDGQQTRGNACCKKSSSTSCRGEKDADLAKNEEYFIRLIKSLLTGELRKRNKNDDGIEEGYSPLIVLDEEEEEEEPSTYIIKHRPRRRGNRRRTIYNPF